MASYRVCLCRCNRAGVWCVRGSRSNVRGERREVWSEKLLCSTAVPAGHHPLPAQTPICRGPTGSTGKSARPPASHTHTFTLARRFFLSSL